MRIRPAYFAIIFLWLAALSDQSISPASAQEAFFQGKTIRIIVGFSAGGGFDVYSRTIARHMGKHITGSPSVLVENMPGAGSMIAANHLYNQAKRRMVLPLEIGSAGSSFSKLSAPKE